MSTPHRSKPVLGPRSSGRLAAVLLMFGALSTFGNVALHKASHAHLVADLAIGIGALALAFLATALPWDRWGEASTLALLPGAVALISFGNYSNPDPYIAGVFFIVVGMWVGLSHRRWVTLALSPALAFALWLPLRLTTHLESLPVATVIITIVTVVVGEVLAFLGVRLDRAQRRLVESRERRFAALTQRSTDVTMIFGKDGRINYVSPAAEWLYGYHPTAVEGSTLQEFMGDRLEIPDQPDRRPLVDEALDSASAEVMTEMRVRHRDGRWIDVEAITLDRTDDPDIGGIVVTVRNIDERKRLERRLHDQAYSDALTGLANRSRLSLDLGRALDDGRPVSVLFLDLDGFKAINDSAGHDIGDQLLIETAARLSATAPAESILARFGGDEFAMVLLGSELDPTAFAAHLVEVLEAPFVIHGRTFTVTASVGVARATPGIAADDLVREADTAMYVAKASTTDRVASYHPSMRDRLTERLTTERELRQAIEREEFRLHFQPIVNLSTGHATGAEALIRWQHPRLGLRSPAEFIDVAESSGLIVPIGRWVIGEACRHAVGFQQATGRPLRMSINVSPRQFLDSDLIHDITAALDRTGLAPNDLKVEITESVSVGNIEATAERLQLLRDLGIRIALDDFGTGYSSLAYLHALPFTMLKIDKSFVDHIIDDTSAHTLIRTINRLGHDLGLETLAEGIETPQQANALRQLGVNLGQGYHFARPMTPDDYVSYILGSVPGPEVELQPMS